MCKKNSLSPKEDNKPFIQPVQELSEIFIRITSLISVLVESPMLDLLLHYKLLPMSEELIGTSTVWAPRRAGIIFILLCSVMLWSVITAMFSPATQSAQPRLCTRSKVKERVKLLFEVVSTGSAARVRDERQTEQDHQYVHIRFQLKFDYTCRFWTFLTWNWISSLHSGTAPHFLLSRNTTAVNHSQKHGTV